jgi:DNA-binding transcriptional MerR regulator
LDLRWLYFVTRLRATRMPVSQIKRYTSLALKGDSTLGERLSLLEAHRDKVKRQVEDLTQSLKTIEAKIASYQALHAGLTGSDVPDCGPPGSRLA